ncbi:MAG: hypothetical protein M3P11_12850 [Actinomycetota bacterium]|nr:hypothetical protein [Actinomycetota bacterium]
MANPGNMICPLCLLDEGVSPPTKVDEMWRYTCTRTPKQHKDGPYSWEVKDASDTSEATSGQPSEKASEEGNYAEEHGVEADLLACLVPDEPFVEHGIVEYRYSKLNPTEYAAMLEKWGHKALPGPTGYTASMYIAQTLERMEKKGQLVRVYGTATGWWAKHDPGVFYHALVPGPSDGQLLSWKDFAESRGLDPTRWELAGSLLTEDSRA